MYYACMHVCVHVCTYMYVCMHAFMHATLFGNPGGRGNVVKNEDNRPRRRWIHCLSFVVAPPCSRGFFRENEACVCLDLGDDTHQADKECKER